MYFTPHFLFSQLSAYSRYVGVFGMSISTTLVFRLSIINKCINGELDNILHHYIMNALRYSVRKSIDNNINVINII